MGFFCKGLCMSEKFKPVRIPGVSGKRFSNGTKKCEVCERFLRCEGYICECCGNKLRTRSRTSSSSGKRVANSKHTRERMIQAIASVKPRYNNNLD